MNLDERIAQIHESQTIILEDDLCCEDRQILTCSICGESWQADDPCWTIPHPCADGMSTYVCQFDCVDNWIKKHWEDIEEFEKC